jgi:hypothetical protein
LNDKGSLSDSASVRAVTYVNAEQAPKTGGSYVGPRPALKKLRKLCRELSVLTDR